MNEQEEPLIQITPDDISQANQLSLNCPICAGPVENHAESTPLIPIVCAQCGTLYHQACWEQNGGRCAILGCSSVAYKRYGVLDLGPVLTVRATDIPREVSRPVAPPTVSPTKKLKEEQKLQREVQRRFFWSNLFTKLLRMIRVWPSDPS